MKRSVVVAACLALGAASRLVAASRDGEVRSVTGAPASGKVAVVIDLRGAVEVQDFTLESPARLVLDLVGAHLAAPAVLYDGQNRGGVKNIRYGQFKPGVVRVVIDLDALKDYHIDRSNGQVRVEIGSERTAFAAWTSGGTTSVVAAAPSPAPAAPPPPVTGDPARVSTPVAGTTETVDEY